MNDALLRLAIKTIPSVIPHLRGRARWYVPTPEVYKTYDYMLARIEGLVRGVYANNVGGDFIDIMANLISGQLTQAYQQAFNDMEQTVTPFPDYLQTSLDDMILNQYNYVDQYFRDIIDARINGTPIDPLLARAELWAQRYTEAYNEAIRLITLDGGGNMVWQEGDTEHKCRTCLALDGIIMTAKEWDLIGVKPQNSPNTSLECGGWKCECALVPTDKRRSPNAYGRVEEIILAG